MYNSEQLIALVEKHGVELVGPILTDVTASGDSLAFVRSSVSMDGKRTPTTFLLNKLAGEVRKLGTTISFVRIDGEREDLDGSLKTMLHGKFGDLVRNSFASFDGKNADVWIEPKTSLDQTQRKSISDSVSAFLQLLDISTHRVAFTATENTPSLVAILKALRIVAPCDIGALSIALTRKGFDVPNSIWMNHELDKLRKAGHVVRRKDGLYFLSLQGLTILGTEKSRHSPDVARALALHRNRL
ncbi:hypothetical protein [Neotabrizicola shimadae]|uniref:Uncharacterized protein n=1 Tax=Neotabrizicola shimadae TaxID=2807096 RepID=A0A8G0ZTB4_9RHOB|nr:hypothetical protein [Neotabrizicola shimadae]QYZ68265.1 hypothetical protein JO391_10715 [Neotabrizicola shimadae]